MFAASLRKIKPQPQPIHLFALWGFSVAQPIYDLLARHPYVLTAHDIQALGILVLCVMLSAGCPLVLWLLVRSASHAWPPAGKVLLICLSAILTGLFALSIPWWLLPDLPLWAGGIAALMLWVAIFGIATGTRPGRAALSILTVAAVAFPLWFLWQPPIFSHLSSSETARFESSKINPPPVVFVIFDELASTALRNGHDQIDATRFPNFAQLATRSTWYRQATTVATRTELALPALLTGTVPPQTLTSPDYAGYPENIFALLSSSYAMHVHEPITGLCAPALCATDGTEWKQVAFDLSLIYAHRIAPPQVRAKLPSIDNKWGRFQFGNAAERGTAANRAGRYETFREFIAGIKRSDHPTLHLLHSMLPHAPYEYTPSGRRLFRHAGLRGLTKTKSNEDAWLAGEAGIREARRLYLWQLQVVDLLIGELVARLESEGMWDESLIVVTADHGVSMRPGDLRRAPTSTNIWDVAAVPMFVKLPGQRSGGTTDQNVEIIDILPTIADVVGIDIPWPVDGQSVLEEIPKYKPRKRISHHQRWTEFAPRTAESALESWWEPTKPNRSRRDRVSDTTPTCDSAWFDVAHANIYDNVVPEVFVPAQIVGTASRILEGQVLIALNGVIVAHAEPYADSQDYFVFADEADFRLGSNRLQVLHKTDDLTCTLFDSLKD